MKVLNEFFVRKAQIVESSQAALPPRVLCRVKYNICNIDERNRNNRKYGRDVWEKVLADPDLKERYENRCLYGHAEHPKETNQSNTMEVSHVVTRTWIEEAKNQVWQEMDVLDTPAGRIVHTLIEAECGIGVSTRADGELQSEQDDKGAYDRVLAEHYVYRTTDFTADPSTYGVLPVVVEHKVVGIIQEAIKNDKINAGYALSLLENLETEEAKTLCESIKSTAKPVNENTEDTPKDDVSEGEEAQKTQAQRDVEGKPDMKPEAAPKEENGKDAKDHSAEVKGSGKSVADLGTKPNVSMQPDSKLEKPAKSPEQKGTPINGSVKEAQIKLAIVQAEKEAIQEMYTELSATYEKDILSLTEKLAEIEAKVLTPSQIDEMKVVFGKKLLAKANEGFEEKLANLRSNSLMESRNLSTLKDKEISESKKVITEKAKRIKELESDIELMRESAKQDLLVQHINTLLEARNVTTLISAKNRALLEACTDVAEVNKKLDELLESHVDAALHFSEPLHESKDVTPAKPKTALEERVSAVVEALN